MLFIEIRRTGGGGQGLSFDRVMFMMTIRYSSGGKE